LFLLLRSSLVRSGQDLQEQQIKQPLVVSAAQFACVQWPGSAGTADQTVTCGFCCAVRLRAVARIYSRSHSHLLLLLRSSLVRSGQDLQEQQIARPLFVSALQFPYAPKPGSDLSNVRATTLFGRQMT
jgi:hypothetical protein